MLHHRATNSLHQQALESLPRLRYGNRVKLASQEWNASATGIRVAEARGRVSAACAIGDRAGRGTPLLSPVQRAPRRAMRARPVTPRLRRESPRIRFSNRELLLLESCEFPVKQAITRESNREEIKFLDFRRFYALPKNGCRFDSGNRSFSGPAFTGLRFSMRVRG